MKNFILVFSSFLFVTIVKAQTVWVIEPAHSSIHFEVPHLSISTVTGNFTSFSGTAITNGDNFKDARISAVIDATSINTYNLERDKHLREDDFLNTKKYPNIIFKATSFSISEDGSYDLQGELTIREVTKPVALKSEFQGIILLNKQKKAGFTARGTINRFDYGLQWNDVLDNGGLIVGEEVDIILNITFLQQ